MTYGSFLLMCLVLIMCLLSGTLSLAIYRDSDVFKKVSRGGRQLNDISMDDEEYQVRPYRESRWESADWPDEPEELIRRRGGHEAYESSDENGNPQYSWFYHNKYINNGVFNHLYNGPKVDGQAGMGSSGNHNNAPKILPQPAPSFGRRKMPKKWNNDE